MTADPRDARAPNDGTVSSYERTAREYAKEISPAPPEFRAAALRRLADIIGPDGTILEIGSGTGRDADFIESLGPHVRRTDATRAFVAIQAERGKRVDVLDMLADPFGGPYDAILAMCVLIHAPRDQTDAVLRKVAGALRQRGAFLVSVREGNGETAGDCHMTYWERAAFAARLAATGLTMAWDGANTDEDGDRWLTFLARKHER